MNFKEQTTPEALERNSFLWSEARLIVAALALFMGGVPPIMALSSVPGFYPLLRLILSLSWLISGVASGYLLYRWNLNNRMLFGTTTTRDTAAFFISIISGINLGLTGLLGMNIGMAISSNKFIFIIVALMYLISAWHLYQRWNASGKKIVS